MRSSPLVSRIAVSLLPAFFLPTNAQSVPGGAYYPGNGAPAAGAYKLIDDYNPAIFFNKFVFYNDYDPTYGHVQYVNKQTAQQNGYATVSNGNKSALISVDTTNKWPNGGPGRPAVRLISDNTYTHGLFILDVAHMPTGCGTWPAYWLLGPNWPYTGEFDIIEGTATFETSNCDTSVNGNSGCGSLLNGSLIANNYGAGLNSNGGGVYATEWTSNFVKTWFFPRGTVPASITNGAPDVTTFGTPTVNQQGPGCKIDDHFTNMSIIINTDFCGAWAGNVYRNFPDCPQDPSAPSSIDACVNFVGNNPSYFTQAYWEINSIKVYQMPLGAQPTSSYSTNKLVNIFHVLIYWTVDLEVFFDNRLGTDSCYNPSHLPRVE
ncbi:hypothetical protein B0A48_13823 [Cryoendolithus antarcticus]|uniref:GH16 domain-containing protein n=1 Tax=Cryoendolithus antarcticus TaxID=1507870 RepID=A0A1V8SN23_9PEZI|nr:hypothetical protein B0A48_13823 [Cryoendolithus antarcticus]